jgi:hypothetical protein
MLPADTAAPCGQFGPSELYAALNELLDRTKFDSYVERLSEPAHHDGATSSLVTWFVTLGQ